MNQEDKKCPNCNNTKLETVYVKDAPAGDILISVSVTYCPDCMYKYGSNVINISR